MKRIVAIALAMASMLVLCLPAGAVQEKPAVKVYETEDVIITIGEKPYRSGRQKISHTFIDERISQKTPYRYDAACNPINGTYMYIDVDNVGEPDIKIDVYVDNGDDLHFKNSEIYSSNSSGFFVEVKSKKVEGLDCDFGLNITPIPSDTEMTFDIAIVQSSPQ